MFSAELSRFIEGGRLAADGVPYGLLQEVSAGLREGRSWPDLWEAVSVELEAAAASGSERGDSLSAAEWLWEASLAAHVSQLHAYEDLGRRAAAEDRRRKLYQLAVPGLPIPASPQTVRCSGVETTGYLRLPAASPPPVPCLILVGGLDSTKEESLRFEDLCLTRGVATFVFDGPGQGETRERVPFGADFDPWVEAVLGLLRSLPEVDATRIGVVGRSLGGHYALRAAANVAGLRCSVAWSPLGTCREWESYPEAIRWGFQYAAGAEDLAQAREIVIAALDIDAILPRIAIPTFVTHGRRDAIVPPDQQEVMRALLPASVRYDEFAGGNHCCHNIAHIVRPMMADWAAAKLCVPLPENQ
jgi:2,6-dihydroxypseudooxynicotine hydrolase